VSLLIRLRRAVQIDYNQSVDWYETRRRGLGLRFLAALRKTLADIADQPDRWPEVWPGVREAPMLKWPFCIYYQVHADHVMVLAVFHVSRDPSVWQSRA
jgi:plasmid stabilization system protein ParE